MVRHYYSHKGESKEYSVMSNSLVILGLVACHSLCPWNPPGKNTEVSCDLPPPGSIPNPEDESEVSELQGDPLMSKPPGCVHA